MAPEQAAKESQKLLQLSLALGVSLVLACAAAPTTTPETAHADSRREAVASQPVEALRPAPAALLTNTAPLVSPAPVNPAPANPAQPVPAVSANVAAPVTGEPGVRALSTPSAKPSLGIAPGSLVRGVADQADRNLALGDVALDRDQYKQAAAYFRAARKLLPAHPAPLVGLALAHLGALGIPTEYAAAPTDSRLAEVRKLLDAALKLDANFPAALLHKSRVLLIQGKAEPALELAQRASALAPAWAEAHSSAAVAALALGDKAAAFQGFQKAAELEPGNAERLTNWGTVLMLHGDVQQAISAFQRAVSLKPDDPRANGDLGTALLSTGNVKGALLYLEKAHSLAPSRGTFMSNLGYAYYQLGETAKALDWCNQATTAEPKLGAAWLNLGIVKLALGDKTAAVAAFRRALALDPSDPRALENLRELGSK